MRGEILKAYLVMSIRMIGGNNMKRFYFKLRIMLMTFVVGLASVFLFNGTLRYSNEISVDLPEFQSESPIIIFPIEEEFIPYCDGNIFVYRGCRLDRQRSDGAL